MFGCAGGGGRDVGALVCLSRGLESEVSRGLEKVFACSWAEVEEVW